MTDRPSCPKNLCLAEPLAGSARAPFATYEAALGEVAPLLAAAEQDRRLARQLLAMPSQVRVEAAAYNRRFRRLSLARLTVLEAEAALFDPTGDPRPWGVGGAASAAALAGDRAGGARRTAALASWLLGKGLLRSWHRRLARQAFLSMAPLLRPREVSEEAALRSAGLAQLHEDLGDVEGATARWLQGAYLFSRLGAAQPAAACQAQLGLLLVDRGDLANALFPLGNAARSIDAAFAPSLAARVRLALAEAEAALGNAGAAREQMERARRLYPLAPSRAEAIERTWREGRVAAAARRHDEAEWLLGAARSALLREGSLEEVARVTLDQVFVRIESGQGAGVAELTGAVAARFPRRGEAWAADLAAAARRAVARPEASHRLCAEMRRRMRRNRQADPRRPALLTSSRMLGDRLLRRRGEHEDPIGAAGTEVEGRA
jgi:tetratricopeptide (TPR) repeat protein